MKPKNWEVIFKTEEECTKVSFYKKEIAAELVNWLLKKDDITGVAMTKIEKGGVKE